MRSQSGGQRGVAHRGCLLQRTILIAVLALAGCRTTRSGGVEREYRFVHMETTGLTSGIVLPEAARSPGRPEGWPDVMIVFSKESDRDAVQSLEALAPGVLLPNALAGRDGDGIVLIGALDPVLRHTVAGPGMAESEPYQEFRMSRWYLQAPFLRLPDAPTPLQDAPAEPQRDDRLRPDDFRGEITGDLARFVRTR